VTVNIHPHIAALHRPIDMTAIPRLTFVVACLLYAAAATAQPFAFTVVTEVAEMAGEQVKVDVYRSYDIESSRVAVLAHGFTRDRLRDRDLANALASAGITAVAPDLPSVLDHWGNGDALAGLVLDLERGALGLPPTPRSRIVLIGTSAGGLATVIAASNLPGLAGWIGLDPVDRTGTGARAAARLESPAVVLLAEPSVCNLFGSGKAIAQAAPSLLRSKRVHGASHCDFEGPTTQFCRTVCGRSAPGMAAIVRGEAVEAAREMLHDTQDEDTMIPQPDNH
jgi:pimeloyl-ACP methyl ester carboxylesterase